MTSRHLVIGDGVRGIFVKLPALAVLDIIAESPRQPGQTLIVIGVKNFRGKDFEAELAELDASIMRPTHGREEQGPASRADPPADRVDLLDLQGHLTLERHGARTLENLRVRLCARFAALAAAISLNHRLGRPTRSLACYTV